MSVVINSNYAATVAANNLAASNQFLQRSLNRLSNGSRIVNPADDAGGLAVSMKLSAAARRQGAAATNIGNANSYLQTQDGVLKVVGKVIERIGELKTLYLDPTKNSTDLANYDAEFGQLQAELTSLGAEKFNGISLFSATDLTVATTEDGAGTVTATGMVLLGTPAFPASSDPFNDLSNWTVGGGSPSVSAGVLALPPFSDVTTNATYAGPLEINLQVDFSGFLNDIRITFGGTNVVSKFNTGVHSIKIALDGVGNANSYLDGETTAFQTTSGVPTGAQAINLFGGGGMGGVTVQSFSVASTNATGNLAEVTSASGLGSLAQSSITSAINDIATDRAQNGASQSRLNFASEVLGMTKANLEAANSRITDVDVAAESTQLARYNILVQAGTAMLSQANQSAQAALRLIS